jgi:hypothetical protein
MHPLTKTHSTLIKALIVITLLFQLVNSAWASNHNCCPEDNPDCVMVNMMIGCTACVAFAIPTKELIPLSTPRKLTKALAYSFNYLSIDKTAIWRPPIHS